MRPRAAAVAVASLAILIAPAPASAQGDLPPGSGVDQYVESLPGAGGGKVPGTAPRGGAGNRQELSARTRSQLRDTSEDRLLRRVASDPELGAPAAAGRRPGANSSAAQGRPVPDAPRGSVPAAVSETFLGTGTGLPVLIGLVLIAAAGLAAAYRRGRMHGQGA